MKKMENATPIRTIFLAGFYIWTLAALGVVLLTVMTSASIVWQTEMHTGHSLTCDEAYNHREINAYFYPERGTQGDVIYIYSLCSPVILLAFVILTGIVGVTARHSKRTFKHWLYRLVGLGALTLIALLAYAPIIYIISCAVE